MRQPNELVSNTPGVNPEKMRGGLERVARRFLPASPAATHIRIDSDSARRAQSRRRLASVLDRRRLS
jgi:hypothetical protein